MVISIYPLPCDIPSTNVLLLSSAKCRSVAERAFVASAEFAEVEDANTVLTVSKLAHILRVRDGKHQKAHDAGHVSVESRRVPTAMRER